MTDEISPMAESAGTTMSMAARPGEKE